MSLSHPLDASEAKRLARSIIENGRLVFSKHAKQRMEERNFEAADVVNVLRGGFVEDVHLQSSSYRYRFNTQKMAVVVSFPSEDMCVVITAMRSS